MTAPGPALAAAQARAVIARARFRRSLDDARQRVSPQRLVADGRRELRQRADHARRRVVADVEARPALYLSVAGGIALFLLRHQVADAVGDLARLVRRRSAPPPVTPPYPGDHTPSPHHRKDEP